MVKIIKQSYEILTKLDGLLILKNIEDAARVCYKSEGLITEDGESAKKLVKKLVERGHTAMLEHGGMIRVKIICNRGLTHELVRHRTAISFAQESTRYCDYIKGIFGNQITVILPLDFYGIEDFEIPIDMKDNDEQYQTYRQYHKWLEAMKSAETYYFSLRKLGFVPQIARGVLPIDIKTEIIVSTNPTEWRHIFKLRTSEAAHPQIRTLMRRLLEDFKEKIPIIFDDIRPINYRNEDADFVKCGFLTCPFEPDITEYCDYYNGLCPKYKDRKKQSNIIISTITNEQEAFFGTSNFPPEEKSSESICTFPHCGAGKCDWDDVYENCPEYKEHNKLKFKK